MDEPPSSSSGPDPESGKITNYFTVVDEADHFIYRDGQLSWSSYAIKDENVIIVTPAKEAIAYIIWSLAPAETPSDSTPAPRAFELEITHSINFPQQFLDKHLFKGLPPQLDPKSNEIYVLISTSSGTGLSSSFFDEILQDILRAVGLGESDYNVVRTSSAESVKEFARTTLLAKGNKGEKQTVLMLSGDGGIVDTINELLENEGRSK
jgi:hypothetical protein